MGIEKSYDPVVIIHIKDDVLPRPAQPSPPNSASLVPPLTNPSRPSPRSPLSMSPPLPTLHNSVRRASGTPHYTRRSNVLLNGSGGGGGGRVAGKEVGFNEGRRSSLPSEVGSGWSRGRGGIEESLRREGEIPGEEMEVEGSSLSSHFSFLHLIEKRA